MTASKTVYFWGFYIVLAGLTILTVPNLLFALLGVPATSDPWPRVVGALAIPLGLYYIEAGRSGEMAFVKATVAGRAWFLVALVALVALAGLPWQLVLFGVIDAIGAAWTAYELLRAHEPIVPFVAAR